MLYIIIFLLSSIIAFIIGYYYSKNINKIIQKEIDKKYNNELEELNNEKQEIIQHINYLNKEQENLKNNLSIIEDQAKQAANIFYKEKMDIVKLNMANDIEIEEQKFQQQKQKYKEEYLQVMEDLKNEFQKIISSDTEAINKSNIQKEELQNILLDLQCKVDSAIEANKRANLEKEEKDYYRCLITNEDIEEIKKIRSIEPYLRDKEPLNKVIWKVYYQKPFTDLIGRIIGKNDKTGIYKITNLIDNKCYVGQAMNIKDRLSQHIKKGIGADTPNRNKLYPAMLSSGVENFMFEVLEECTPQQLNEREKYWISYYHAQDYGYNENIGGSAAKYLN